MSNIIPPNDGCQPDEPGRKRKSKLGRGKLRKMKWWPDLLLDVYQKSHEPFEMTAIIRNNDLIIVDCGICGRRHNHGRAPDEVAGSVTSRQSHCTGVNVPILLHIKEAIDVS